MNEHESKVRTYEVADTDTPAGTTREVGRQMGDTARQTAEELSEQARRAADEARHKAKSTLENQKGEAAHTLHSVADALRGSTGQLRQEHHETVAYYTERLAEQVDRFSDELRHKDVDQLMHDVENFARRRPEVVLGAAVALGFLAARFLKSHSPYQTSYGQPGYTGYFDQEEYGRYGARPTSYDERFSRYRQDYTRHPDDYGPFGDTDPEGHGTIGTGRTTNITDRPTQPTRPESETGGMEDE
jgi:gas vesicle protein